MDIRGISEYEILAENKTMNAVCYLEFLKKHMDLSSNFILSGSVQRWIDQLVWPREEKNIVLLINRTTWYIWFKYYVFQNCKLHMYLK